MQLIYEISFIAITKQKPPSKSAVTDPRGLRCKKHLKFSAARFIMRLILEIKSNVHCGNKAKTPRQGSVKPAWGVALSYKRSFGSAVILDAFILEEGLEPIVDEHRGYVRRDYNDEIERVHCYNPLS